MKQRAKTAYLCCAMVLGLLLTIFISPPLFAEDIVDEDKIENSEDTEELPVTTIEGEPEGTIFQDLFSRLEELIAEEGYTFAEGANPPHSNLALAWNISSDETSDAWFSEELILTDMPEAGKPLKERNMSAMYTARTSEDVESFLKLDSSLAEAFGIPESDLLASASANIADWGALIEIPGTGSTLEYYYTLAPYYGASTVADNSHTLSAEIKPIGYEGESLIDVIAKLADYLYEVRPGWAEGAEQYYVRALISEQELETQGVNYHSVELIRSSYTDTQFVRHYIDFDNDVSQEDSSAIIAYLEENTPEEITGLQENWEKSFKEQEYISLAEGGWSTGLAALNSGKTMWVFYRLDSLDVFR